MRAGARMTCAASSLKIESRRAAGGRPRAPPSNGVTSRGVSPRGSFVLLVPLLAACLAPPPTGGARQGDAADLAFASAATAGQLARRDEHVVLGHDLVIAGGRARLFGCATPMSCGRDAIEVPAESVRSVEKMGRAALSGGGEVDVVRLVLVGPVHTTPGGTTIDERGIRTAP